MSKVLLEVINDLFLTVAAPSRSWKPYFQIPKSLTLPLPYLKVFNGPLFMTLSQLFPPKDPVPVL